MSDNPIQKMRECDLNDEDGFREWTKQAQKLSKDFMNELSYTSTLLFQILRNTPVSNPRSGALGMGDDSKAYARKVRGYLSRAAQSSEYIAGQVTGAWTTTEQGFLVPSSSRNRGMNTRSRSGRSGGGTRRGA